MKAAASVFTENPFRGFRRRLFLATSGSRVGSHLLIDNLYNYGVSVDEYFNTNRMKRVADRRRLDTLQAYCEWMLTTRARSDVVGIKGGPFVLQPLTVAGEFPEYKDEWSFVYLWRADLVRQAISLVKARLSGSWNSATAPSVAITDGAYDGRDIRSKIDHILLTEARWREIFEMFAITPIGFSYEDLVRDPAAVAAGVAGFAGLDGTPIPDAAASYEPQADELNDRWSARFRQENAEFCLEIDGRVVLPPP